MTRRAWLWLAAVAGPAAWFGDLLVSYAIDPGAHRPRDAVALLAVSAVALAIAVASGLLAWRERTDDQGADEMLAHAGLAMSALSALLVIATALPTLLLIPGGEP